MTCEELLRLLDEDGPLGSAEAKAHLHECPECRAAADWWQSARRELHDMREEPTPPFLHARIMAQVRAAAVAPRPWWRAVPRAAWAGPALLGVVLAAAGSYGLWQGMRPDATPLAETAAAKRTTAEPRSATASLAPAMPAGEAKPGENERISAMKSKAEIARRVTAPPPIEARAAAKQDASLTAAKDKGRAAEPLREEAVHGADLRESARNTVNNQQIVTQQVAENQPVRPSEPSQLAQNGLRNQAEGNAGQNVGFAANQAPAPAQPGAGGNVMQNQQSFSADELRTQNRQASWPAATSGARGGAEMQQPVLPARSGAAAADEATQRRAVSAAPEVQAKVSKVAAVESVLCLLTPTAAGAPAMTIRLAAALAPPAGVTLDITVVDERTVMIAAGKATAPRPELRAALLALRLPVGSFRLTRQER
jgi:hypothetical protein